MIAAAEFSKVSRSARLGRGTHAAK